ncbi:MAG: DNA-directed RNA polymerase subunit beta' [Holophagales bacterium]|nr:DNA-directed RNA polymerase subunit beta' [Holophagales bacterium]MYH23698.1 DNA-directed RNA polymerase subunit beta' [Holophagales bacterium]
MQPLSSFEKTQSAKDFNAIKIALASPEKIRSWSFGEVTKAETINYRTFKPERDGLFCAKIFGPMTDWECLCGKYKRMKHRGVVCDKCGVEVTRSRVRRERMGHIELASPASHVWFFKGLPSRIGHLLDLSLRNLERILYFESYVVIDPGDADLEENELVSEERYRELREEFGPDGFDARMGAEAIKELLARIDIDELAEELRIVMRSDTSQIRRLKAAKRLKVVNAFRRSGHRPEWMILDVIPVIPPELRPLVPLDGGRFATSDLNDLYRRVINRNNRLKKLLELRAPEVIVRNEKRMLQEAVDALFDNGRRGRVLKGSNNRPLKSLSDTLKGKQGRFRQNLLGKRVDYSGRSVIVVGPDLKLNECGLPKKMALELFKPFIYSWLEEREYVGTIKAAKEMVEREEEVVWDALDEVIRDHPVLLNRAPTLHRLGIQAFQPVLIEGKAIQIHPLVCAAFNADFDGDQMAVHVPLSPKAQIESHVLMQASNNILSPAHGRPLAVPSQDLVLGGYYLTMPRSGARGEGRTFASVDEVLFALEDAVVETQTPIRLRLSGPYVDLGAQHDTQDIVHAELQQLDDEVVETTVGRVILNDHLPDELPFINGLLRKRGLQDLVGYCFIRHGADLAVRMLDEIKEITFQYATRAGISFGVDDMVVPSTKEKLIEEARGEVLEIEKQRSAGVITAGERKNKIIDIWHRVTENVSSEMFREMKDVEAERGEFNPINLMADSGARGSREQVRQLAGMRGLMSKPSGEVIETPIHANFREGLSVLQYFISTHGARKGLADTALKTADSGYLTRRLVDVAQDVIVTEEDCGTIDGIVVGAIMEGGDTLEPLRDRLVGRVSQEDIFDPMTGDQLLSVGDAITEKMANNLQAAGIERAKIRSVLTCETRRGVCAACYGRNLATGRSVDLGEAVGVIAAQSIGEPGTQLTMRTFHFGGTASRVSEQSRHAARNEGWVKLINVATVDSREGALVVVNRNGKLVLVDEAGRELERHPLTYGSHLLVHENQEVKPGTDLVEWDPFTSAILSEVGGHVEFHDIVEGENVREETDKVTGLTERIIVEASQSERRAPALVVASSAVQRPETGVDPGESRRYSLPVGAHLVVNDGAEVHPGDTLAKIPRETTKTKDITGGLPRVQELFEARKPRGEAAVVADIDGVVRLGKEFVKGNRVITVENEAGEAQDYTVARNVHVNVQDGEFVNAGDVLVGETMNIDPRDILRVKGERELQRYLVDKIQEVYRSQSVAINDKHIEVIVRQMMRSVEIEEVGDTDFLIDEQVDRWRFKEENERVTAAGGTPAIGRPLLLGITKASLSTESFISAASFQETTRVLTEAAISGRVDHLRGLKENVIVGRVIPAGTGMDHYHDFHIEDVVYPTPELVADDLYNYDYPEEFIRTMPQVLSEGEN